MADEGGFSGALMEIEDVSERKRLLQRSLRRPRYFTLPRVAAALSLVAVAVFVMGLRRNAR